MTEAQPASENRWEGALPRIEWVAAGLVAAAATIIWIVASRDLWFFADAWDFTARREFGSVDGWLTPHLGHLQIPAFLVHRALYGIFELDYFPWYVLPHTIGFSIAALLLWRSMLHRGADRFIAFGAFLLVLFIGTAEVIFATVIGAVIVLGAMALLSLWLEGQLVPTRAPRIVIGGMVLLLLATGSSGVIVAGSAGLIVLFDRRRWKWLPSFIVPAIAYLAWWLTWASDSSHNDFDLGALVTFPRDAVELIGLAMSRALGFPEAWRWAVGIAVLLVIAWLGWKGRLGAGEALYLVTALGFVAAVLLIRVADGVDLTLNRYSIFPAIYLIVGLAPALPRPPARAVIPVLVAGALLVGYAVYDNASARVDRVETRGTRLTRDRVGVDAVASFIIAGEPVVERRVDSLGSYRGMTLTTASVRMFVGDGYRPPEAVDPELLAELRPLVRVEVIRPGRPARLPITAPGVDADGCLRIGAGQSIQAVVHKTGTVRVEPANDRPTVLDVIWSDRFGIVEQSIELEGDQRLEFAEPTADATTVTLRVPSEEAPIDVCGVDGE